MLFVDYNPVKSLREWMALPSVQSPQALPALLWFLMQQSISEPSGYPESDMEWEHSAVVVKFRLVLAAPTSLHLIGSVLSTSQVEFKAQSCPWGCNISGLSFRGANATSLHGRQLFCSRQPSGDIYLGRKCCWMLGCLMQSLTPR